MSSYNFELNGNYYKYNEFGKLIQVFDIKEVDTAKGELEREIPNLKVGTDLLGNIISLSYEENVGYTSILGKLPSTPLSNISKSTDPKNKAITLMDLLKLNSMNQVKALEEQNELLKADLILKSDLNKNMSLLNASLSSLASSSSTVLNDKKSFYSSSVVKNSKLTEKLNYETTGLTLTAEKDLSIMEKLNGVVGSFMINSDGDNIIPMHEKAKKDSEKAIETKHMNAFGMEEVTVISDLFDSALESSDLSNFNPFEALLTIVKEDTEAKINLAKLNGGT